MTHIKLTDLARMVQKSKKTRFNEADGEKSQGSEDAEKAGLIHKQWGQYADPKDPDTIVAKVVNGKLQYVKRRGTNADDDNDERPPNSPERQDDPMYDRGRDDDEHGTRDDPWREDDSIPSLKFTDGQKIMYWDDEKEDWYPGIIDGDDWIDNDVHYVINTGDKNPRKTVPSDTDNLMDKTAWEREFLDEPWGPERDNDPMYDRGFDEGSNMTTGKKHIKLADLIRLIEKSRRSNINDKDLADDTLGESSSDATDAVAAFSKKRDDNFQKTLARKRAGIRDDDDDDSEHRSRQDAKHDMGGEFGGDGPDD